MTEKRITDLGEEGLIRRIARACEFLAPSGAVGIGDDCAVVPLPGEKVRLVTTDLLVEDVHFLRSRIPPEDLGHKSLAVNLSDIAAMGGTPREAYLSLALPRDVTLGWVDAFLAGLLELAEASHTALLGGDTTGSRGPIVVNIAVVGDMPAGQVRLRSHARPGDVLCVTGDLGDSAAGLRVLLERHDPTPDLDALVRRHHRPRPHLAEGRWLARQAGVHAMMDVSDGIDLDLRRLLTASRCGAIVDLERLPVSDLLRRVAPTRGWCVSDLACTGGEDYCLLATVSPEAFDQVQSEFEARFGRPLHRIGRLDGSVGSLRYHTAGHVSNPGGRGFDHFGTEQSLPNPARGDET